MVSNRSMVSKAPFSLAALASAAALGVLAPAFEGSAAAKLVDATDANVVFHATGPAGLAIEGKGSSLAVQDDGATVTVVVGLAGLKTGIDLRDKHMKEKYLQVASFPNAELTVARSALKFPAAGALTADAPGRMTLHGKTKEVTVHYTANKEGTAFKVAGSVDLDLRDYAIDVPSYLGVTVKPQVRVDVAFRAEDK